jgi:hypothetical protein
MLVEYGLSVAKPDAVYPRFCGKTRQKVRFGSIRAQFATLRGEPISLPFAFLLLEGLCI